MIAFDCSRRVGERVGGFFTTHWGWHHRGGIGLDTDSRCIRNAANHLQFHHPPIDFVTPDLSTTMVLNDDQATLQPLPWMGRTYDLGRGASFQVGGDLNGWSVTHRDVAVMTARNGPCLVTHFNQENHGRAFMIYNGTGYMHGALSCCHARIETAHEPPCLAHPHKNRSSLAPRADPRMALFDNTLESTSETSLLGDSATTGLATRLGSCHNVPKTFQNAHTCRPSTACSPVTYRDASVLLNHSSLRIFHQLTNSHIYAVTGLRLEGEGTQSPCIGTARWRKLDGPCGAAATALDAGTKATLAQAIRESTDASNPFVRDAIPNTVEGGTCVEENDGVSATGAKVDVDGECWEHSHPFYLNVYEMDQWVIDHPGNMNFPPEANPIKAYALRGESILTFPASHAMSRFATALPDFGLLGKLGDEVSFRNLPTSVQNAEVAAAFDALIIGQVSESCGSPGEVANLPTAGFHWHSQGGVNGATGSIMSDTYSKGLSNGYHGFGHTIHWKLAMTAPDQLRQRAAHALIQVYVMSFLGTDHNWNTEIFINYFEILVRSAFGNLRTIIKEVSYSGMMASYLTFQNSESLAASGTLPDENYARESMQLFSIGLVELTEDGSYERDSLGNPIETYDTMDIGEFAKCWTGFSLRGGRNNIDVEGHSRGNRIDPMRIRGNGHDSKRDLFPKTNLYGGHLGDGYPLCADLPERHFLAKGARWSYIGHAPDARLQPEAISEHTKYRMHGLGVTQYRFGPNWHWTRDEEAVRSIPRIRPNPATSPLYQQLCGNRDVGSPCNFTSEVYLPSTLACDGDECAIDTVAVVDITDTTTNETVYYE